MLQSPTSPRAAAVFPFSCPLITRADDTADKQSSRSPYTTFQLATRVQEEGSLQGTGKDNKQIGMGVIR